MKPKLRTSWVLLLFISLNAFSQATDPIEKTPDFLCKQATLGLSGAYSDSPFLNFGCAVTNRIRFEGFLEVTGQKNASNYLDINYRINHVFNRNLHAYVGLSMLNVPSREDGEKINKLGVNVKLTQPLTNRIALFASCHLSGPDKRASYSELVNVNLGIGYYFDEIPYLFADDVLEILLLSI